MQRFRSSSSREIPTIEWSKNNLEHAKSFYETVIKDKSVDKSQIERTAFYEKFLKPAALKKISNPKMSLPEVALESYVLFIEELNENYPEARTEIISASKELGINVLFAFLITLYNRISM